MIRTQSGGVSLSSGERLIRTYPYQHISGKGFEVSSCLTMTDKRLIHRNVSTLKDKTATHTHEIPIADVDSVESFFTYRKKPMHLVLKFMIFVFIVLGAFLAYMGAVLAEALPPLIIGLVFLGIGVLMLILGLCLRKRMYAFTLEANRLSYMSTTSHLCLDNSMAERRSSSKKQKKAQKKSFLFTALGLIVLVVLIVVVAPKIAAGLSGGGTGGIILVALLVLVAMVVMVLFAKKRPGTRSKAKSVTFSGAAAAVSVPKLKVEIDAETVKRMLNEIGALVYDLKENRTITETNLSETTQTETNQSEG